MRALLQSLDLQRRVIGALLMRELHTRYGKENIGFLWIVVEPAMFAVGVSVMWSFLRMSEHNVSVVGFVITGYNPLTLWRHCVFRGSKAFEANGALLFHRQVTTIDIIVARILMECFGSTAAFMATAGGAMALGLMDPPKDLGLLYAGWFYVMLFSGGTCMVFAGLSEMSDVVEKIIPVSTYISIPLSGAFTMVDWLPYGLQPWILLSPSVNAFEMIRGGWFGPGIHPHYDVVYLTWTCVLQIMIGLYLIKKARAYILVV